MNSLTAKQLEHVCSKSSIDCSKDYCQPGSILHQPISEKLFSIAKTSPTIKTRTIAFILGLIVLVIFITFIIIIFRWRKTKKILCCHFPPQTTTTIAEATRRRRQHHKHIIDNNPAVIESVVTHGANMNDGYLNDEISNNKRKLYNPMFADSPTLDIRHPPIVSNDNTSPNNYLYSEHL